MDIVIALLIKDKEAVLPVFLKCLLLQTFQKERIHLYVRTNDNTDLSREIIQEFLKEHGSKYKSVYYDDSSISEGLKKYKPHEWNVERFKILGAIRQESVQYAIDKGAHYFVIDIDNFILPWTLSDMVDLSSLGVLAPMLTTTTAYSNYHSSVTETGYLQKDTKCLDILLKRIKGCIVVPVVHCTYFIHNSILPDISYNDKSNRYEYVIFSDVLRKKNIPQYIINNKTYGYITFSENREEFEKEWNIYITSLKGELYISSKMTEAVFLEYYQQLMGVKD